RLCHRGGRRGTRWRRRFPSSAASRRCSEPPTATIPRCTMAECLLHHESAIRLAAFLGVLALLLAAEHRWPRRALPGGWRRRGTHLALVAVDTLALRLAFPVLAIGAAAWGEQRGIGLLPRLSPPAWVAVPIGLLLLDLALYWQHRLMHAIPLLWRLHRVHH